MNDISYVTCTCAYYNLCYYKFYYS